MAALLPRSWFPPHDRSPIGRQVPAPLAAAARAASPSLPISQAKHHHNPARAWLERAIEGSPPPISQVRRMIVRYDNARRIRRGETPAEQLAYGVQFPDRRIAIWHTMSGFIELFRSPYELICAYSEQGNVQIEFVDAGDDEPEISRRRTQPL